MTGPEIRAVRESLQLSQTQLASLLGVHAVTVSRWETGIQHPTPYQAGLIQQFGRAAQRKEVATQIAAVLVGAGAIAGLFFLLKWALEDDEQTDRGDDAHGSQEPARKTRAPSRSR